MIERAVQYTPTPGEPPVDITVRISDPRPVGEDWTVTLEIAGFHAVHRSDHHSVDSMGAVMAAMRIAPVVLESFAGPETLTWLGEPDLGFPFLPLSS